MGGVARVLSGKKTEVAQQVVEQRKEQPAAPATDAGRSEMAERTAASLRARRRGAGRAMLLGGDDEQSTLG